MDKRTEGSGNIADYNYKDLPLLRKEIPIDFMPGVVCFQTNFTLIRNLNVWLIYISYELFTFQTFTGESEDRKFPLLEDTFRLFPDLPINIDIKMNNDELIYKVS